MNVVFLSPAFPPTARQFSSALAKEGVTVLGIGDRALSPEQQQSYGLTDYVFEPRMSEYQPLRDVTEALRQRHGQIDRIDSNGEHWLPAEAHLRDDLGVPGLSSAALSRQSSKLSMAVLFAQAQIAYPPTVASANSTGVRAFAAKYGYPLVCKPEIGSGAVDTYTIDNAGELESVLEQHPQTRVVQPFIAGQIITFDGLADRDGRLVFWTSHVYDDGIMQVRRGKKDGYYYSLRELPQGLEEVGRRAVEAFGVRERFFHVEFFRQADGSFVALEMNLRPPGGFTTDMMNAACEVDVYALWAATIAGRDLSDFRFDRKYHTAHAGRRVDRRYRHDSAELKRRLGATLVVERPVPAAFAATMGDMMYLLRDQHLEDLMRAIALVQEPVPTDT
ncbi:MAG TPA: hypothetical protein VHP33_13405 [Polyangiaceae bacterium]|nr:hypothetical protein [Polyangiaceae bacterium]